MPLAILLLALSFGSLHLAFPWWIWALTALHAICRFSWRRDIKELLR